MQPGWCQPVRQEFMENECEALPGVAEVRDNRSTLNTKTGYDDDDSLTVRSTPAHVRCYSYHASTVVNIVSGEGRNATVHDPKLK